MKGLGRALGWGRDTIQLEIIISRDFFSDAMIILSLSTTIKSIKRITFEKKGRKRGEIRRV